MSEEAQVAIVGAGFAGLAAARRLAEHGVAVRILEARDRVGGRAHTLHPEGELPAELGPEYVHGEPEVTLRLLREARGQRERVATAHHLREGDRLVEFPDMWRRFARLVRHAPPPSRDESARDYLARQRMSRRDAHVFGALIEGFFAASLGDISIASIAADSGDEDEAETQTRVRDGYGSLASWLLARIRRLGGSVELGRVVRSIDWTRARVQVAYDGDGGAASLVARHAIITLPLGVLLAGDVTFYPQLGDHARALRYLAMGPAIKVVACLHRPIWREHAPADLAFVHGDGTAFPTFWVRSRGTAHQLTAWAGGPHARAFATLSGDAVVARALADFARTLAIPLGNLETAVAHHHFHDYNRDPFARGAYSYTRVGGGHAPAMLARPLGDRLFFAGEATDADYEGSVAGALASGERAADQVLERLRARRAA